MVSVIIPVYNVMDYLPKCLDSVKNQTLTDIEVIIVDDGSTDGSGGFCDRYAADLPHFKVFHKENGGLMSAWTYGVRQSTGDYIGFVDSDDYVAEEMFEKLYTAAKREDAEIVYCDYVAVKDGIVQESAKKASSLKAGLYTGEQITEIRNRALPGPDHPSISMARWNKLFCRELFFDNLKYSECLSKTFEDRYIVPECLFSVQRFYYLPEALYFYTLRGGSNSGMYKKELLSDIQRMYGIQKQALLDKGLYEEYRELYEKAYMDYIRLYVTRNIINVQGFKNKGISAKNLLKDPLTRSRMKAYGHLLDGKTGMCMKLAYRLHMPILLAIGSYFA